MKWIYIPLHILLMIFSLGSVCSKMAAGEELFSGKFFLFYGVLLLILAVYAVVWQQMIKRMPLTAAYANRAVTVVWGMVWGLMIFQESITLTKVIGSVLIIAGIILFAFSDQEAKSERHVSTENEEKMI